MVEEHIEEPGIVVSTDRDRAEVQVMPHGGCEHCSAAGVCNWTGKREKQVLARNTIGAKKGQTVVIGRTAERSARSSLLVFGLPGVLLLLGVVLGSALRNDRLAAGLGGAGLLLGIAAVLLINRLETRSGRNLPQILRFASEAECKGATDEKSADDTAGRSDGRG